MCSSAEIQRESLEHYKARLCAQAERQATQWQQETVEQHEASNQAESLKRYGYRQQESFEQSQTRRQAQQLQQQNYKKQETEEQHYVRLQAQRTRQAQTRSWTFNAWQWNLSVFNYNPQYKYATDKVLTTGSMSKIYVISMVLKVG